MEIISKENDEKVLDGDERFFALKFYTPERRVF